jgi:hypothetical protein
MANDIIFLKKKEVWEMFRKLEVRIKELEDRVDSLLKREQYRFTV